MDWLPHNPGLKVVALVLAVLTWFFVKGVTSDWRTVDGVPLEILPPPGMTVLAANVSRVNVMVRGTREDVSPITRQDLSAVVDLSRQDERGELNVKITPRMIRHSRRVRVTTIEPSEVTVTVDEIVERMLTVRPVLAGELPNGLKVERVMINPETVRIRGPQAVLEEMDAIATLPIDITGRRTSFRERVELIPLQLANGATQRHWVEVDVRVGVAPSVDSSTGKGVEEKM